MCDFCTFSLWAFCAHRKLKFLISSFRRVQNVVCFLLGDSPASDLYMPTFRNTLSVPSSKAPAFDDGTDRVFRNVGIYKSKAPAFKDRTDRVFRNVGIYKSKAPAFEDGTDRVFRNVGIYKSKAPAFEDGTVECSETSAYINQTPGNRPKENKQQEIKS